MMHQDIHNCICRNTKKWRYTIHYVKPTAQLLFKIRFPKGGPTCRKQVVNPIRGRSGIIYWWVNLLYSTWWPEHAWWIYIQCVSVEVEKHVLKTSKNVVISVIYRPPNTDVRIFIDKMNILLDTIMKEHKLCYLLGDYNLIILNYDTHDTTAEFIDILYSHAILPLINRPTRVTQSSATAIDNIFTNDIDAIENGCHGILVTDISDHFPIFHIGNKEINSMASGEICLHSKFFI